MGHKQSTAAQLGDLGRGAHGTNRSFNLSLVTNVQKKGEANTHGERERESPM